MKGEYLMILNKSVLKSSLTFVSLLKLFGCVHSSVSAFDDRSQFSNVDFDIIEGDLGSAYLTVNAFVENEKFNFQLDTGANKTYFAYSPDLIRYPVIGQAHTTSAAGITLVEEKMRLPSFRIGDFKKNNFEVIRYKEGVSLKNRLGTDALPNKLYFDFKNKKIKFDCSSAKSILKNKLIVYNDSQIGMEVKFGKETVEAVWDTGAELSVIDQDFVSKNSKLFQHLQTITNGLDATGNTVKLDLYNFDGLEVEGKILHGTIMSMDFKLLREKIGKNVKMILGTNLIRNNNWCFDRTNKTWSID